jgi:choline dehydrogenase-like flavoprotein
VPRVELDWRPSPSDRYNAVRPAELVGQGFAQLDLGRTRLTVADDEPGWPSDLERGWHHMGTTRMSADPRQGVVDPNCRIHGMSNLFVAGSSVFPTGGSSTPTFTIVALALRLADHLKREME